MSNEQKVTKQSLIDGLNKDLSHEYQAVIMYTTYAASVTGIYRKELKEFFQEEIPDELAHAQYIANKITALGGVPTTKAADVMFETDARKMLEHVVEAESETVERYVRRMKEAEAYGDYGLANELHDMIADETRHKEEAAKLLQGSW